MRPLPRRSFTFKPASQVRDPRGELLALAVKVIAQHAGGGGNPELAARKTNYADFAADVHVRLRWAKAGPGDKVKNRYHAFKECA